MNEIKCIVENKVATFTSEKPFFYYEDRDFEMKEVKIVFKEEPTQKQLDRCKKDLELDISITTDRFKKGIYKRQVKDK